MSATSLKPVIEKLESLFSSFNQKFYNSELQTPVITVSPDTTKGAYGWCTSWKAWSNLNPDNKTTDISQMSKADLDAMQNEGFDTHSVEFRRSTTDNLTGISNLLPINRRKTFIILPVDQHIQIRPMFTQHR